MAKTKQDSKAKAASVKTDSKFSKYLPHLLAFFAFIIVTVIFFSPMLFDGKVIQQGDIQQYNGAANAIKEFRDKTHTEPLWTNSMFGGMPSFQISTLYFGNLTKYVNSVLSLGFPQYSAYLFIACVGFYILLLVLEVSPWLAILGAIAYALSSYNLIILEAGHNSKMHAISLMPYAVAGAMMLWRKKYFLGGSLSALALSLLVYANHVQIAYYVFMALLVFFIVQFIYSIREKELKHFAIVASIFAACGALAVFSNLSMLWSTYDYGNVTIRGKSELTTNVQSRGGLDKDYAYGWSYGKSEALTLMIPNVYGGSSHGALDESSAIGEALSRSGYSGAQLEQTLSHMPLYWGAQPFTSGPVYVGAIICFLFVLGLILVEGPLRWWLGIATVLSVLLSFGHNLHWFSDIFFDYFPGYNKFRTVTMVLVIAQFTMPLLGLLALAKVLSGKLDKEKVINGLYIAGGVTAGLCLLIGLFGSSFFDFKGGADDKSLPEALIPALLKDRASIMRSDAFRSFFLITIAAGLLWAFVQEKLSKNLVIGILAVAFLFDFVGVGKRFVNSNAFVDEKEMDGPRQMSPADQQILQDKTLDYRVFNTTVNSFNDASTSYFHKSVGGYHAAKLRRYQELIENQIQKNNMAIFDMLNTKYFIVKGQDGAPQAQQNPNACGNAWFVDRVQIVANADEEMKSLDKFNPREVAFIDKRFSDVLSGYTGGKDSASSIQLESFELNHLVYQYTAPKNQVAVFSEIYYQPGWVATIDGKEAPMARANYILRAMNLPAGSHKIEMKFEPKSYIVGEKVAMASSSLILLLFGAALFFEFRKKQVS